jgi:hypothetical protein
MQTATQTQHDLFEELDYRENDGIQVSLLWNRGDNSLTVFVVDTKTDVSFELPIEGRDAVQAFRHPYAFAARHGIDVDAAEEAPTCNKPTAA